MWFCVVIPRPLPTPIHWKVSSRVDVWYGNREIPLRLPGNAFRKPPTIRQGQPDSGVHPSRFRYRSQGDLPAGSPVAHAGNSFLGAFFRVSLFLQDNQISEDQFREIVRKQYDKKFGRFGEAVVESNMEVMTQGFNLTQEIVYGEVDDPDTSSMRLSPLAPLTDHEIAPTAGCAESGCDSCSPPEGQPERPEVMTLFKIRL